MSHNANRKKVLFLRSSLGVFGAERVVLEIASGLANSRYESIVGVIGNKHPSSSELADRAAQVGLSARFFPCQSPFDLGTVKHIRRFVRDNDIAIVHAHGYKANFYALAATWLTNVASVATCHPWTETSYSLKSRIYTFLDKLWLRRMDRLTAVSADVQQQVLASIPGSRCDIIANGIAFERFEAVDGNGKLLSELGLSDRDTLIGTIGRLVPEKGYRHLLASARNICAKRPDAKVLFIGDGPQREELENAVRQTGLEDCVRFLGVRRDIPEILALLDVFVLPSITEGLPMVLLEAMAAGKPIVATEVGDIPKVIQADQSGLLVPPANEDALSDALLALIEDTERANRLAARAREEVVLKFSGQKMVDDYISVYDELLNAKLKR
jgi:glycosyltransferase involved in cell wall biosynthesis